MTAIIFMPVMAHWRPREYEISLADRAWPTQHFSRSDDLVGTAAAIRQERIFGTDENFIRYANTLRLVRVQLERVS